MAAVRLFGRLFVVAALALGCRSEPETADTGGTSAPLVVYSGRSETLVGPLLQQFEESSGIRTEVRWGDTGELAAAILEEGAASPAKVFLAQDAVALATLAQAGRFRELPAEVVAKVESRWADSGGRWIGLSGRLRTMVLDPARIPAEERPQSLVELADPRWAGRLALAPSNASLQAHLAAWRALHGGPALQQLLRGIAANKPALLPKNTAVVEAVLAGEAELGLVNHYYLLQAQRQRGAEVGINWIPSTTDGTSFVNLAGVGVLEASPSAINFVEFLLGEEAQRWFAEQTFEIPLARDAPRPELGFDLDALPETELRFEQVAAELQATVQDLRESGLLP